MTWSVIVFCVWVLLASFTAMLPMRRQYVPGVILLVLAPVLIVWLGIDFGWLWASLALVAFVSLFRNPLKYIWARVRGHRPEIPR